VKDYTTHFKLTLKATEKELTKYSAKVLEPSFDSFPTLTLDDQYKFWRKCFSDTSKPPTYLSDKKVMIWLLEPFGVGIDLVYIFCQPHDGLTIAQGLLKINLQKYIYRFLSRMAQVKLTYGIDHGQDERFGQWNKVYEDEWHNVDQHEEVKGYLVEDWRWAIKSR
jgi:hypothetical protein